jgi:hypothetical protein
VRYSLPRERFDPPRRLGRKVRARVEEVIVFHHDGRALYPLTETLPATYGADSTGLLRTVIPAHIPFDSLEAPRLTEQERWAVYAAVTEYFIRHEVSKPSAFCIAANDAEPPASVIEQWRFTDSALVPLSRCPPTFARMFRTPRDPVAPPGYEDPVRLDMRPLKPWARDLVVLQVRRYKGMGTMVHTCQVLRRPDGWTEVQCRMTEAMIS